MPPKKAVKESGDDSGKPTKRKAEKSEASPAKKKKPARDSGSGSEDEAPAPVKAAKSAAKGKATVPQVDDGFPRNTTMPTSYSLSTAPSTHIKIVSWNVSSLKAAAKKGLPEYVAAEDADVWLLQETKLQDAKGIDVFDESKYPHQFWLSSEDKKGYSGSAVLSKIKPISSQYGIGVAEHDGEGRTITLEFEKYYIIACYIPNAGQKLERLAYKAEYMTAMEKYLADLQIKKPVIWAGDLNVAHQEMDLARPKENKNKTAGFTDQERGDFTRILDSLSLVDAYRQLHPDEREYTYFSYRFQCRAKHLGWRLDYFVVSKGLLDKGMIGEAGIRNEVYGASDHVPIVLTVEK